jgi:hypothetical protein
MVGARQVVEPADYSAGSFFGPLEPEPSNAAGNVVMSAWGEHGKGRVALWTDSTLFSNFAVYLPGKREIALNTLDWLNRRASLPLPRAALAIVALALGAVSLVFARDGRVVLCVLLLPAFIVAARSASAIGLPSFRDELTCDSSTLQVYEPVPLDHFAVTRAVDDPGPEYYMSALMATQRAQRRPSFVVSSDLPNPRYDVLLVSSEYNLVNARVPDLQEALSQGSDVILLDALNSDPSLVAHFLERLAPGRLRLDLKSVKERALRYRGDAAGTGTVATVGGLDEAVLTDEAGAPVAGWLKVGSGRLFVAATQSVFADSSLGDVHSVPDPEPYARIRLIMDVVRQRPRRTQEER